MIYNVDSTFILVVNNKIRSGVVLLFIILDNIVINTSIVKSVVYRYNNNLGLSQNVFKYTFTYLNSSFIPLYGI